MKEGKCKKSMTVDLINESVTYDVKGCAELLANVFNSDTTIWIQG
jgi:hypothetical protein